MKLRSKLSAFPEVTLYQAPTGVLKTPTIAFTIKDANPAEVCKWLSDNHAIFIASGDFYASTLAEKLGVMETGGWIRAGLAPYNTEEEINYFISAIEEFIGAHVTAVGN